MLRDNLPLWPALSLMPSNDPCLSIAKTLSARILNRYFDYYLGSRTRLYLAKDAPTTGVVLAPEAGQIVEIQPVGGLHYRYKL